MARKKHGLSISINGQNLSEQLTDALLGQAKEEKRPYNIIEAHLKDGFCNYVFEINEGLGKGEKHKVDGAGMIMDTLATCFSKLAVHMAAVDGIFQHSETEVEDIDLFHNHDLTYLYHVSGIKFYGTEDNEMVVLIGSKRCSYVGGRANFSTPKIPLDKVSSYKWYNELLTLATSIREEVSKYKEGNYILLNQEDDEEHQKKRSKVKQKTISDELAEQEAEGAGEDMAAAISGEDENFDDFDNARQ